MKRTDWLAVVLACSLVSACGDDGGGGGYGAAAGAAGGGGQAGAGAGGTGGTGGLAGGGSGGVAATGGTGGSTQSALLAALGTSVWSGLQTREGKQRAIQLEFDAGSLLWAETRNPYGPARRRRLRIMQVQGDDQTVNTTLTVPAGWPVDPDNGKQESYSLTVTAGSPRTLQVVTSAGTETYTEGAWPAPTSGLTAIVRVFANGGAMAGAFCEKSVVSGPDRSVIWNFARAKSTELALGEDIVAGVPLASWIDPTNANQFAVTDIPGMNTLGGTLLSDQFNFIVLYTGTITHAGGSLGLREQNDEVTDAIWAFLGPGVGSAATSDVFLEVHGHIPADLTPDAPSAIFPGGDLAAEFMVLRCSTALKPIQIEINQGSGFVSMASAATKPKLDSTLFPPAL
ncbi:MAG: hypothetical protein KF718_05975 [Polyangiaceae bacterium]|nr:hypothetical protein [Polyangiaceae bacterium]